MVAESPSSLDRIAWSGQIGLLAADAGHLGRNRERVRLRRTLCATDANRDPSRLTAAHPASRKPPGHPAWESGTARSLESELPRPSTRYPLPLTAAEIIRTVAGRLPLSAEGPTHPKSLYSPCLHDTMRHGPCFERYWVSP